MAKQKDARAAGRGKAKPQTKKTGTADKRRAPKRNPSSTKIDAERAAERELQVLAAETDEHLRPFQSQTISRVLDGEARRLDAAAEAGTRRTAAKSRKKGRAPSRGGRARGAKR